MPEDQYFRPRNWAKFQSKSNNSMAWVKACTSLLSDPDYTDLTENQKLTWLELLLLTGRTGKPLPLNSRWIGSQLSRDSRAIGRALPVLLSINFIELCERTSNLHTELPTLEEKRVDKRREKETPISPLDDDLSFNEFWSLYPRQRRGGKQKACSAWKVALARASPADILLGLRAYVASDEVKRGFAKGAAAWLNDDRWTTDYLTFREKTAADLKEEFLHGDQRGDLGSGTIDGQCVDVSRQGPEINGNGVLPCAEGFERPGSDPSNRDVAEQLAEGESAEAGRLADNRRRVQTLSAQAAKATKARTNS